MGIPSVQGEVLWHLTDMLHSLFSELRPQDKEDSIIVVLIAAPDPRYTSSATENIKAVFLREITQDPWRSSSTPASPLRVSWRIKQNLYYCFLMTYVHEIQRRLLRAAGGQNHSQAQLKEHHEELRPQEPSKDWMILEFSELGFIGKIPKSLVLSLIVEFTFMFYRDKPIDCLLDHILRAKHCDRQKVNLQIRFKPPRFQHVGMHCSLAGKTPKLKGKDFGKQELRMEQVKPPAEVATDSVHTSTSRRRPSCSRTSGPSRLPHPGLHLLPLPLPLLPATQPAAMLLPEWEYEHPRDKLFPG